MFKENMMNFDWTKALLHHNIKKIFIFTYVRLSIIFVAAVLLKEMQLLPSYFLNYTLLGYLLPLFALPLLINLKKPDRPLLHKNKPLYIYLAIIIIFVFTLAIRLLPYAENQVPLGHDPGYYMYTIDLYRDSLPVIPESSLPFWIKKTHEQGFLVLFDALHIFGGMSALQSLIYFFPFLSALLILPVFILTRSIFDDNAAILACGLYSISYTQFTAFTFMYLKNIFGLFFLLLALYALEKKKYMLISVMFAALGAYHRPEFLLFSLILMFYFLKDRDKNLIYSTVLTAILIAPFWLPRIDIYFSMISDTSAAALQSIEGEPAGGGTFYGFEKYEWVSLIYLPFGITGALYVFIRKMWNTLFFYLAINGIVVVFKLFFYNRLIINFDIVLLILASSGILYTFLASRKISKFAGLIFICLLIVSGGLVTLQRVHDAKPLMSEGQIGALEWISENTEKDAFILTTSYDAPWALAWSERKVLAPGLFEWNEMGKKEWLRFLASGDPLIAEQFFKKYNDDIYIYYSFNRFNSMNLEKFNSTSFTKITKEGAVIYRYNRTV